MKRLAFISFLFVFVLSAGCKKEEETYKVSYKIVVDGGTSGYTVRYTLQDGTTASRGPLTDQVWSSNQYEDFKRGFPLMLQLDAGPGNYTMFIFVNGSLMKQRDAGAGTSKLESSTPL